MATTQPTISSGLLGYVEQHNLPLISKMILGNRVIEDVDLRTGIKGNFTLTEIDADPVIQCGNECGWTENGTTTFTPTEICVQPYKVNMAFCDKNLLDTWMNYEVQVAAGNKTLPFEEYWTGQIVNKVQNQLEEMIWGILEEEGGGGVNQCLMCEGSGVIPELLEQTPSTPAEIVHTYWPMTWGTADFRPDVYEDSILYAIMTLLTLRDFANYTSNHNYRLYMSYESYGELLREIMHFSKWHIIYEEYKDGIIIPGTNIKAIPTMGLNNFNTMTTSDPNVKIKPFAVLIDPENIVVATDLRGDSEKFDLWYSKDNREFRLAIEFIFGSGLKDPKAACVLGTRIL